MKKDNQTSVSQQKQHTTIAIQGATGSFHSAAARKFLPSAKQLECKTFQEVFEAVTSGKSTYGLTAIENSLHGSINPVYRLLDRNDLWIAGEITLQIGQYLIGCAGATLEKLNTPEAKIISQSPALSQCELWLDKNLPLAQRVEWHDTADSVRLVVEEGNPLQAAIAAEYAATIYGGTILAGPINDDPNNYTRFVFLQKDHTEPKDADRTSIILATAHTPGALYHALGVFVDEGVNLSKIDSHPIACDTRNYAFYIDFDVALSSPQAQRILSRFKEAGHSVRILGSYKADHSQVGVCNI